MVNISLATIAVLFGGLMTSDDPIAGPLSNEGSFQSTTAERTGESWRVSQALNEKLASSGQFELLCVEFGGCPDLLWYHPQWLEEVSGKA